MRFILNLCSNLTSDVLNLNLQGYKLRISVATCIDIGAERIHSAFIQLLKVFPVSFQWLFSVSIPRVLLLLVLWPLLHLSPRYEGLPCQGCVSVCTANFIALRNRHSFLWILLCGGVEHGIVEHCFVLPIIHRCTQSVWRTGLGNPCGLGL